MRWKAKERIYYKDGDERKRTKFLFFPKCALNRNTVKHEWRWLEKTSWIEVYTDFYDGFCWKTLCWID